MAMVERTLPDWHVSQPSHLRADKAAGIVFGMASLISQSQKAIRFHLADNFFKSLYSLRQASKKLLIGNAAVHQLTEKNRLAANNVQRLSRLLLSNLGIGIAGAILVPEILIARGAVSGKHHHRLFHPLHEGAESNDLIIRVRNEHHRRSRQWLEPVVHRHEKRAQFAAKSCQRYTPQSDASTASP